MTTWASPRGESDVVNIRNQEWNETSQRRSLLRHLDLRFQHPDQEQRYKQGLVNDVILGGLVCIGCAATATLFATVPTLTRELSRDQDPLGETFGVRDWVFIIWSLNLVLMLSFIVCGCVRFCKGYLAQWNWEAFFVVVVSIFLFSTAFANFWHFPFVVGADPTTVWAHNPRGSDIFMLLGIDAILTMVAMYVPIRSSVLWIPFVFAVLPFFVNTIAFESVFSDSHMVVFALLGLSAMAYHGALRRENTHRQKWALAHMVEEAEEVMREQDNTIQETTAQVKGLRVVAEALCDVILKVDSKMHVRNADQQQDAFFETKLEGRRFEEFLSEQDRSRFANLMSSIKVGFPACLPLTIRKQHLNSEVHLLAVDTGMTREPRYLIGIRIEAEQFSANAEEAVRKVESVDSPRGSHGFSAVLPRADSQPKVKVDFSEEDDISCRTYPRYAQNKEPLYTPARSRALCIKKLLPRWQVPRDTDSCCQYHTVVDSMVEAMELLANTSCEPLFQTFGGAQCQRCLCMCNREQRRCAVCGYTLEENAQHSPHADLS